MITSLDEMALVFVGLCLGSFAGCVIYREPREMPWLSLKKEERFSRCPSCGTVLGARDLVPVLSWIWSRGRCRHCGAPVSKIYPLAEISTLAGMLGAYAVFGFSAEFLFFALVIWALVALLFIDLEHMILPNNLVFSLFIVGLFYQLYRLVFLQEMAFETFAVEYLLGALIYGAAIWALAAVMQRALKRDVLGFGDVKFFAAAGIWLGLSAFPVFCILSGVLGVVFALVWKIWRDQEMFPFGPGLIIALYVLFLGKEWAGSSFFF